MKNLAKKLSLVFAAGCIGGLLNSLAVWIFGEIGITSAFGVKIAPQLSATWLYPRIVWGGIWGVLFLLPLMEKRFLYRGLIFSLGPTIVQLFIVFPIKAGKGSYGTRSWPAHTFIGNCFQCNLGPCCSNLVEMDGQIE